MYEGTTFISFSAWYWIDSVRRSRERISESRRWGRRSCKQLSDTVTERKNLLPNSDLLAERDCIPAYAHAESYGQSYTRPVNKQTPLSDCIADYFECIVC